MRARGPLLSILCLLLLGPVLPAQTISYLHPDLGAPGMNTYIEIIGPASLKGNFGSTALSKNNLSDNVQVSCVRPEDARKVTFGPVIVSWDGRMASTMMYVHPWVRPNSMNWRDLAPEFRIPVLVRIGGIESSIDTVYLVQPQPAMVQRAGDRLGTTTLAPRSRRGAMIVEGLTLDGGGVKVENQDCDPGTPGNQGMLPFTLLSRGPIQCISGGYFQIPGEGSLAGPGGGGGGGKYCDATIGGGSGGQDGGNGFTGGGRGGKNSSGIPFVSNEHRNPGTGTGANISHPIRGLTGGSLNGVQGGSSTAYEAAGGGTGHPFGSSGDGCADGGTCRPVGAFGGGAGGSQRVNGGAGGFATPGFAENGVGGGQPHGNAVLVPLAGGSGGASGNPQTAGACSGNGGGGGGGIRVFAPSIPFLSIDAGGQEGEDGSSDGGSGSGGGVIVESKLGATLGVINVAGGGPRMPGGAGRLRVDGPSTPPSSAGSLAIGLSTDTTSFVKRSFTLTGTGNGSPITLFLRPFNGEWTELTTISVYSNNRWSFPITLPGLDSLYFLAAVQTQAPTTQNDTIWEPAWILSQSAANIFRFSPTPKLAAAAPLSFDTLVCDTARTRRLWIHNEGEGPLSIASLGLAGTTPGLTIDAPTGFPLPVAAGDSIPVVLRYRAGSVPGEFQDTLLIASNDPDRPLVRIPILIRRDLAAFALTPSLLDLDSIIVCSGVEMRNGRTVVRNTGTVPLVLRAPDPGAGPLAFTAPSPASFPRTILPGDTLELFFTVTASGWLDLASRVDIETDTSSCSLSLPLLVTAIIREARATLSRSDLDLTASCPGDTDLDTLWVLNTGDLPMRAETPRVSNPAFQVEPSSPFTIPVGGRVPLLVTFAPPAAGSATGSLILEGQPCAFSLNATLRGRRDSIQLALQDTVTFGLVNPPAYPVTRRVLLSNPGAGRVTVTGLRFRVGTPFSASPPPPWTLDPGATIPLDLTFSDPGRDGTFRDTLELDASPWCGGRRVIVSGNRGVARAQLTTAHLSGRPGERVDIPIVLRNGFNLSLSGSTRVQTTLRFRSAVLVPTADPRGAVINRERVLTVTLPLPLAPDSILGFVPTVATLGDEVTTELILENSRAVDGFLDLSEVPGSFTLIGLCEEGGTRLFRSTGRIQLQQNHPNPFNSSTVIGFSLREAGPTRLFVVDALGREVSVLFDQDAEPGSYTARFDAGTLPAGLYRVLLVSAGQMLSQPMLLVK